MIQLSNLKNITCINKRRKRVGRGPGSKRGKTSTRGHKGDKSRSGYKTRYGKEGGQVPFFKKLPIRGFSRERFKKPIFAINLETIDALFEDNEIVNYETLRERSIAPREVKILGGVKILGKGELTKAVKIEATKFSKTAIRKLEKNKIEFKII